MADANGGALGSLVDKGILAGLYWALISSGDLDLIKEIDALPVDQLRELEAAYVDRARSASAFIKPRGA